MGAWLRARRPLLFIAQQPFDAADLCVAANLPPVCPSRAHRRVAMSSIAPGWDSISLRYPNERSLNWRLGISTFLAVELSILWLHRCHTFNASWSQFRSLRRPLICVAVCKGIEKNSKAPPFLILAGATVPASSGIGSPASVSAAQRFDVALAKSVEAGDGAGGSGSSRRRSTHNPWRTGMLRVPAIGRRIPGFGIP